MKRSPTANSAYASPGSVVAHETILSIIKIMYCVKLHLKQLYEVQVTTKNNNSELMGYKNDKMGLFFFCLFFLRIIGSLVWWLYVRTITVRVQKQ